MTPEEAFFEDGSVKWSKVRGAFMKWAKHIDKSDLGLPKGNPGDEEWSVMYKRWEEWVNRRLDGVVQDCFDIQELRSVFLEFYRTNDEFQDLCDRNYVYVSSGGGELARGVGNLEEDEEEVGDEEGSHYYSQLYEVGIVTDDGVDVGKLKGSILKFVEDVEVIEGTEEEPNVDDIRSAWSNWMMSKVGGEWPEFKMNFVEHDDVNRWVEVFRTQRDGFWEAIEEKWEHCPEKLEGNGDSDDGDSPPSCIQGWKDHARQTQENGHKINGDKDKEIGEEDDGGVTQGVNKAKDNDGDSSGVQIEEEITGEDVIHGDSTEVIQYLIDEDVDIGAIVTDPPYGQEYDSRGEHHDVIEADDNLNRALSITEEVLKKSRLILREGSPIVVFAGKTNLPGVMSMLDKWYDFEDINVWDKGWVGTSQIGGTPVKWRPRHEYGCLAMYGDARIENENRHDGNVWEFQRLSGDEMDHPTEKPVELLRYVIKSLTEEGDVVFDPFAGSGSTLVAAQQTNRGYIGVEYDERHYKTINDNLKQGTIAQW